jgi:hypothetical protein
MEVHVSADEPWVPLSLRGKGAADDWHAWVDGVPEHLRPSLLRAMAGALNYSPLYAQTVQRRLRLALPDGPVANALMTAAAENDEVLLDVIDCLLDEACSHFRMDSARSLDDRVRQEGAKESARYYLSAVVRVLAEANSVYEVELQEGRTWALRRRVDETATRAVEDAVAKGHDAGALLASAWSTTFQLEPDLVRTYSDVVLAVESAACPVLIPNSPTPTLGTAIAHLKQTTPKWTVAGLDDKEQQSAETLLAMLETIWQNHGRHVEQGGKAPEPVQQDEAEAVLFLAVTVVQWFQRGFVTKKP